MGDLVRRGAQSPTAPSVSIIVPVLERVDALTGCLKSLRRMVNAPPYEVVVVGNGTPDALIGALPEQDFIVVVSLDVNLGFAGGCNWGARFASGQRLVFLNDDTEVTPGWLGALVEVAESSQRIGAVGSLLLDPDGRVQEAGSVLWRDGGTYQVGRGLSPRDFVATQIRSVDYCSACGLLVKRNAWDAVGGFDEAYYPAYHEDVDLCLSLRAHGFRTVFAPRARLRHYRGGSLSEERRRLAGERSGRYFLAKWGHRLNDYEPHPDEGQLESAVAAAMARTARRPLARPEALVAGAMGPPTEIEALRTQIRALGSALKFSDDYAADLKRKLVPLRGASVTVERARQLARGLPFARQTASWVSGHLAGWRPRLVALRRARK